MRIAVLLLVGGLLGAAGRADAKTYRYQGGPPPAADTMLSVAEPSLEPVVRARGPRVPLSNLQLVTLVANTGLERGLASAPQGQHDGDGRGDRESSS